MAAETGFGQRQSNLSQFVDRKARINACALHTPVPEGISDGRYRHAFSEQVNRKGMAQRVWVHTPERQSATRDVNFEQMPHGTSSQRFDRGVLPQEEIPMRAGWPCFTQIPVNYVTGFVGQWEEQDLFGFGLANA